MRTALFLIVLVPLAIGACKSPTANTGDDDSLPDAGSSPDGAIGCAPGLAGAPCVLELYDQAKGCDAAAVAKLAAELDARAGLGPLWADGRALFRTDAPTFVAGTFNNWSTTALATAAFCGKSDLVVGVGAVASGFHTYKLVDGQAWSLDAKNPAFAYDDFTGNADGRNSVLDTPDSGRGHLVKMFDACSSALGNCRAVTAYLPAGYDAPANASTKYPVLFMHDGKNVWDDHSCCFGHTGWEVNVTLDAEIAAGRVAPVVVIAADQTTARNDEYGLNQTVMAKFIDFQIGELQPKALGMVRGDGRVFVAGSSLGGLVSMELALRHPGAYAGVASLSGAFWPGMDTHTALRDEIPSMGKQALAIYVDSGGNVSQNSDGAADTVEVRDLLVNLGWHRSTSPMCTAGPDAVCYWLEANATHDELAWKARAWRFLRYLFPPA